MDAGSFSVGAAVGGSIIAVFSVWYRQRECRMIDALRDLNRAQDQAIVLFRARLSALRRNCFITNERGHRVRYSKASPDLRAMAETE